MNNQNSLLKARYCRSVMRTAGMSSSDEAQHLISRLATELITSGTSREVEIAERDALAAIFTLSERFRNRSAGAVAGEWKTATEAVLRWIAAAEQ